MSLGNWKIKQQLDTTRKLSGWQKSTTNDGEDLQQQKLSFIAVWNEKWYNHHFDRQFDNYRVKHNFTTPSKNQSPKYLFT